jgi:hypothetical protein
MLNIRTRAVAERITFDLLDADDSPLLDEKGKTVTVTVFGPGSKEYQKANQAKTDKLIAKMAARGGQAKLTSEEAGKAQAEFLTAITVSIDLAYDDLEGREKVLAIYSDHSIGYISEQVSKKVGDWGNFKKP